MYWNRRNLFILIIENFIQLHWSKLKLIYPICPIGLIVFWPRTFAIFCSESCSKFKLKQETFGENLFSFCLKCVQQGHELSGFKCTLCNRISYNLVLICTAYKKAYALEYVYIVNSFIRYLYLVAAQMKSKLNMTFLQISSIQNTTLIIITITIFILYLKI